MRKQRKKPQAKKAAAPQIDRAAEAEAARVASRRKVLIWARNGAIAVPVLGAAAYFGTRSVQATISEADLTRIGTGRPAIVQIHDPQCSQCRALQAEAREALEAFDEDALTYLVADINTTEGRNLAARHGVSNVTLLLFDGDGGMRQVVRGVQQAETLEAMFSAHLEAFD